MIARLVQSPRFSRAAASGGGTAAAVEPVRLLSRAGVHELYAASHVDSAAATGFAIGTLRQQSLSKDKGSAALVWVRHELAQSEAGHVYPPGLLGFGLSPAGLTLVRASSPLAALQAGLEAARCSSLAAILVEIWGEAKAYDLTASRRLSLASKASHVPLLLIRHAAREIASAAETRFSVRGLASRVLAAQAPGRPCFEIALMRRRAGASGRVWCVEWSDEKQCFEERNACAPERAAISGPVAALPAEREAKPVRRAG